MSLCVKVANKKYPFFQAVFTRSIFQVIGGYIGCKIIKINPWGHPDYRFLLICRGMCGAIGITLFFAGMTYLPLGDNTGSYIYIFLLFILHMKIKMNREKLEKENFFKEYKDIE